MKLGPIDDCRSCGARIMICRVRGGKWWPFDLKMIAASPDAVDAYLPLRAGTTVALVPIEEASPRQLQGVRWYAQRHRCAEYFRAKAAERERVGSLGDVLAEHFGLNRSKP